MTAQSITTMRLNHGHIIELIQRISNTTFIFIQRPHEHISCGQRLRPLGWNRENNSRNSGYVFLRFLSMVSKSTSHTDNGYRHVYSKQNENKSYSLLYLKGNIVP